jgi:hypothetical protein
MENGKKPAFYNPNSYSMQGDDGIGLTKREYFAGLALQAYSGHYDIKKCARLSVETADALLAELEKTKEE